MAEARFWELFFYLGARCLVNNKSCWQPLSVLGWKSAILQNLILQYTASTLLGDHRNFKVIEKPARPDLVLKCQMLCWLSGDRNIKGGNRSFMISARLFSEKLANWLQIPENLSRVYFIRPLKCVDCLYDQRSFRREYKIWNFPVGRNEYKKGRQRNCLILRGAKIFRYEKAGGRHSAVISRRQGHLRHIGDPGTKLTIPPDDQMIRWSDDYQEQMCFMQRWPFEIFDMNHYCVVLDCFRPLRAWRTPQMSVYYQNGSAGSKTGRSQ